MGLQCSMISFLCIPLASVFVLVGCTTTPPPSRGAQNSPEVQTNDPEAKYIQQAKNLILPKSRRNVQFKVLQSFPNGCLCVTGQWDYQLLQMYYTGDVFYWIDTSNSRVADEEKFHGDMYWCGTYSYLTTQNTQSTVNAFTTNFNSAIQIVRKNFGFYDAPVSSNTQEVSTTAQNPIAPLQAGTGFAVSRNGYILTNYHVISAQVPVHVVIFSGGGKAYGATLIASDQSVDLALLKIELSTAPVTFATGGSVQLGETVFTIGFPSPGLQGISPKVTMGIISGLAGIRDDVKTFQIDAAVQPGNSGGPMITSSGEVVGVVSARISDAAYSSNTGVSAQNVNYALKNSYVLAFLESQPDANLLVQKGKVGAATQELAVKNNLDSVFLIAVYPASSS